RLRARELLLEARDQPARPELQQLVAALAALERLAVDRAHVVHDDEVAFARGLLDRLEPGSALAQRLELGLNRLVGGLGLALGRVDALVVAELRGRAHADLDRERQRVAGEGRRPADV